MPAFASRFSSRTHLPFGAPAVEMEHHVKRTRNWCLTIKEGHGDLGAIIETRDPDFAPFFFNNKEFQVFIGPVEGPDDMCMTNHRHVGIRCLQQSITKTAAAEAMEAYCNMPKGTLHGMYCQPLESNWPTYIQYARKTTVTSKYDENIKLAAQKIRLVGGQINKLTMKRKLVEDYGLDYFNKRLKVNMETFLETEGQLDTRGCHDSIIDRTANARYLFETFTTFQRIVAKSLLRNGCFCLWRDKEFTHAFEVEDFQLMVEFLALVPSVVKRVSLHTDCLPGLFLFGTRSTGKSTFFVNNDYYKKVATDAEGVSRYKLDGVQTALLLDDVNPSLFMGSRDGSTLKQLALGAPATVKTCGSTVNVNAWLVCTSNHPPPFMKEEPPSGTDEQIAKNWRIECDSWKRRFIILCLGDVMYGDPVIVNWNDYEIRDRVADLIHVILEKLKVRQPVLYNKYLEKYHRVILRDYTAACEEPVLVYQAVDYEDVKRDMEDYDFRNGSPEMMMTASPRVIGQTKGEAPPITNTNIPPQELRWVCQHPEPIPYNDWCSLCEQDWKIRCEGLVPPRFLKVCDVHKRRACGICFEMDATDVIDDVNMLKYM